MIWEAGAAHTHRILQGQTEGAPPPLLAGTAAQGKPRGAAAQAKEDQDSHHRPLAGGSHTSLALNGQL